MKFSRLILNAAVALVLAALVVLVLFAHLSMRVKPTGAGVVIYQDDFAPGHDKTMNDRRLP